MQHFLKPSVVYQRQREDWRNHRNHLANLLLRIFTVSSADRRLIIRAFSQSSCHQSARTRLRWEENLVPNSGNYTSLQHLQFFCYNVWSWSFVSLGSPKSEDTHLALLYLHEHTPAIEYTGNKKKKKIKTTVASRHLFENNIRRSFFSSIFQTPKENPENTNTSIFLSELSIFLIWRLLGRVSTVINR